jgi:putative ABC transport system permease protein
MLRPIVNSIITRFVDRHFHEEFIGDLEEIYEDRLARKGRLVAETMYCFDAVHLLIGFSSTTKKQNHTTPVFMGNMFKMAWRNALRQKQFTILNVLGLTLGIATCVGIGLYVFNETTYDTFHPNGDRMFRINQPMIWGDWDERFAATGPGVAGALREDIQEFEEVTRLYAADEVTVRLTVDNEPKVFVETRMNGADENFFKVFQFPFVAGDPATALKEPASLVITETTARRYFGSEEPMGKLVEVRNPDGRYFSYTVKGVLKDLPDKSHLRFDVLFSMSTIDRALKQNGTTWIWTVFGTYVLVKEGTDLAALTEKMQRVPPKWAEATTQRVFNQTVGSFSKGKPWTLYLQPVREIYLSSAPTFQRFGPSGNRQFVIVFAVVGILVLTLSCINFMNLSTARSGNRAKEVGIRKVLGSQKGTLINQFIVESTMYVATATVLGLIIVHLTLGAFNSAADTRIQLLPMLKEPWFIGVIIAFIIVLGILAGFYPAFYMSAFQPAETLKGKVRAGFRRKGLRNLLVVFQFTVSIVLIICTFFVQKQLSFTSNMNVGLIKDHVLVISRIEDLYDKVDVLKTKLQSNPAFTNVATSYGIPPNVWEGDRYRAEGPDQPVIDINYIRADEDYLPLLGVEFLVGRNFDPGNPNDKYKIILNEEAVRKLGWGTRDQWKDDSPIGKKVVQSYGDESRLEVVGVVRDFNFSSARVQIQPLLIMHTGNDLHWSYNTGPRYMLMRLNPSSYETRSDLAKIIEDVKHETLTIEPSLIFQYSFLDEEFDNSFRSERQMSYVLNLFTCLAAVIACLGLFGLAAFSAEQRLKELGIRRVMGAKVHEIVVLFSSEFTKLVLLAILIAVPLAWYLTDYWLSNFAYRTTMDAWVFILAAACALMIAAFTVSYQALSAATANPVDTLRNE